jgi:hypothetical protein
MIALLERGVGPSAHDTLAHLLLDRKGTSLTVDVPLRWMFPYGGCSPTIRYSLRPSPCPYGGCSPYGAFPYGGCSPTDKIFPAAQHVRSPGGCSPTVDVEVPWGNIHR